MFQFKQQHVNLLGMRILSRGEVEDKQASEAHRSECRLTDDVEGELLRPAPVTFKIQPG